MYVSPGGSHVSPIDEPRENIGTGMYSTALQSARGHVPIVQLFTGIGLYFSSTVIFAILFLFRRFTLLIRSSTQGVLNVYRNFSSRARGTPWSVHYTHFFVHTNLLIVKTYQQPTYFFQSYD